MVTDDRSSDFLVSRHSTGNQTAYCIACLFLNYSFILIFFHSTKDWRNSPCKSYGLCCSFLFGWWFVAGHHIYQSHNSQHMYARISFMGPQGTQKCPAHLRQSATSKANVSGNLPSLSCTLAAGGHKSSDLWMTKLSWYLGLLSVIGLASVEWWNGSLPFGSASSISWGFLDIISLSRSGGTVHARDAQAWLDLHFKFLGIAQLFVALLCYMLGWSGALSVVATCEASW